MAYFRTSYATLQRIAQTGRFEDLAAFLVLARHANGRPPMGLAPHTFSGAGVNAIHEKAGLSEESARGALQRLQELMVVRSVTAEVKKASYSARWELIQGEHDLDLPHALADSQGDMESALLRIRRRIDGAEVRRRENLASLSDTEFRLDVLMLLIAIYRHTSMSRYGGLSPRCCFRSWDVKSQSPKSGGVRWGAEPESNQVYPHFSLECIERRNPKASERTSPMQNDRFWYAFDALRAVGLIYEAVSLFDVDPRNEERAQLQATLRVNDFHAGAADGDRGDPSLLRELERAYGATYAFYTHHGNERAEPEAMWVVLPSKTGFIIGIWRPRFRASNSDAGSWYEAETLNISALGRTIAASGAF